jgi:hypothetical protein
MQFSNSKIFAWAQEQRQEGVYEAWMEHSHILDTSSYYKKVRDIHFRQFYFWETDPATSLIGSLTDPRSVLDMEARRVLTFTWNWTLEA